MCGWRYSSLRRLHVWFFISGLLLWHSLAVWFSVRARVFFIFRVNCFWVAFSATVPIFVTAGAWLTRAIGVHSCTARVHGGINGLIFIRTFDWGSLEMISLLLWLKSQESGFNIKLWLFELKLWNVVVRVDIIVVVHKEWDWDLAFAFLATDLGSVSTLVTLRNSLGNLQNSDIAFRNEFNTIALFQALKCLN